MKCRLCVSECIDEVFAAIYDVEEEPYYTKLIVKYLHLEITPYDELSTGICLDCKRHLQEFHEFFEKIEQCQQQLKSGHMSNQSKMYNCDKNESNAINFEHIVEPLINIKDEEMESGEEFCSLDDSSSASNNEPLLDSIKLADIEIKTDSSRKQNKIVSKKRAKTSTETEENIEIIAWTPEKRKEGDELIEKNIELKCEICAVVLPTFKEFKTHYRSQHKQRSYITCCGLRFLRRLNLIEHLRIHHVVSNEHSKKVNEMSSEKRRSIENQMERNKFIEENIELKCEICGKIMSTYKEFTLHFRKQHTQKAYITCCGLLFRAKGYLIDHLRLHDDSGKRKKINLITLTPEEDKERDEFIEKNIELKCEICGEVSSVFKEFQAHFRNKHNQSAYITCCGLRLEKRWALYTHTKAHVDPDFLKCKYCKKTLKSLPGLRRHIIKYHEDFKANKLECEICHKRFVFSSMLKDHMNSHITKLDHQCEVCQKGFKTLKSLRKHNEIHGPRKLFVCHICGRELLSKDGLDRHTAIHEGGSNNSDKESISKSKSKCSICNKWFSNFFIKTHMDYHNHDDVECKICGKILSSKGALKSHIYGPTHKPKKFDCKYCGKTFGTRQQFEYHINGHTRNIVFPCKYCSTKFTQPANRLRHMKKFHADEFAKAKPEEMEVKS